MSNAKYDPPLSEAGIMDLVCALQASLNTADAIKLLALMPTAQREAALQLDAAATHYVETVEGRRPKAIPFGGRVLTSAMVNAISMTDGVAISDPKR